MIGYSQDDGRTRTDGIRITFFAGAGLTANRSFEPVKLSSPFGPFGSFGPFGPAVGKQQSNAVRNFFPNEATRFFRINTILEKMA
jgi:hypothetical protein